MASEDKKAIHVANFRLTKGLTRMVERITRAREQPMIMQNLTKGPSIQDILWRTSSFEFL